MKDEDIDRLTAALNQTPGLNLTGFARRLARAVLAREVVANDPHRDQWVAIAQASGVIAASPNCGPVEARALCDALDRLTAAERGEQPEQCSWTQDDEGSDAWFAGCGKGWFRLDDGTPSSNRMSHCCYCGKPLVEMPWTEPEGDE